jgi:cytochrome c oxidase assembly protein subunit 15
MKALRNLSFWALVVTYLVVLAGAVVRATGSGMGCPDWPKCFGMIVPPTRLEQLPADYKTRFLVQGKEIADFNAFHTWTEYLNRLLGVASGLLILAVLISALRVRKQDSLLWILAFFLLLLTVFQAWLGALVVSSNLAPLRITVHMIAALIMLALLLTIWQRSRTASGKPIVPSPISKRIHVVILGLLLLQLLLGSRVRQNVDAFRKAATPSDEVVEKLGSGLELHAALGTIIWLILMWLYSRYILPLPPKDSVRRRWNLMVGLATLELGVGIFLKYMHIPQYAQPIHLLSATILAGAAWVEWQSGNAAS